MNLVNQKCLFLEANKGFSKYHLRVPLSCLVHYKGLTALAIAKPPYEDENIVSGPILRNNQFQEHVVKKDLEEDLSQLATLLNIKEHNFQWTTKSQPCRCFISFFTEVYKAKDSEFQQIRDLYSKSSKKNEKFSD